MTLTITQWHQRYLQQARWTQNIRAYLFEKSGILGAHRIMDIGCGTGVLEREFTRFSSVHTFGVDIDLQPLKFAKDYSPESIYTNADCLSLPFPKATFEVTFCHFLLLWIKHVQEAVDEMSRVTRPGGAVLALAEPDYGGRVDFPLELRQIGDWQTDALKKQGADPWIGRQLSSIFSKSGLVDIEAGVLGGQWRKNEPNDEFELEWQVIESDLQDNDAFKQQAGKLKSLELASRKTQQRILFVPVFYALGIVPQ